MKKEVLKILEKIAKDFDLKFNEKDFDILVLSKKEAILLNYVLSPIYSSFGKTPEERLKNIDKFLSSKESKKELRKKYHGGVCKNIFLSKAKIKLLEKYLPEIA